MLIVNNLTINVQTPPVISISPSSPTVCFGKQFTLTASGSDSYTWTPGLQTGSLITINPTSAVAYTVDGLTNVGCASSQSISMVVNPNPTVLASANPTSICSGSSSTLTASGASGYTWNPSANITGPTCIVSPSVTTIYSVVAINTVGCMTTVNLTLVVLPLPTISILPVTPSICLGSAITLIATGANSYTWHPALQTGSLLTVSPNSTSVYTVEGLDNNGCSSAETVAITVNSLPTLTAMVNTVSTCPGSSFTLTAGGANSYTWQPDGLTGSVVVVNPLSTTIYSVTGLTSAGCASSQSISVGISPFPVVFAAANPTANCPGSSSTLTASGASGYTWSPSANITGPTLIVSPSVTTVYSVVTPDNLGCLSSVSVTFTVFPSPTITILPVSPFVCSGGAITLITTGADSYTLYPGLQTSSLLTTSPSSTGVYTVNGLNNSGCSSSQTVEIIVNPLPTVTAISNTVSTCPGSSYTLTASGANNYTWQPGSLTGSVIIINPVSNSIYSITGLTNAGCASSQSIPIMVYPIPTLGAVANPTSNCPGGSSTLTASGASSYTWLPGALNGSVVVVNPFSSTAYTVIGELNGCSGATTIATSIALSSTVLSTGNLDCLISQVQLSVGLQTQTATVVRNGSGIVGANAASSITVNAAGIYTAVITDMMTGCTASPTISVLSAAAPLSFSITPSTNFACHPGPAVTLLVSSSANFTWYPSASTSPSVGSIVIVTPSITSTYTVVGLLGTCSGSTSITIPVQQQPTLLISSGNQTVCARESTKLLVSGAQNYFWQPGNSSDSTLITSPAFSTVYTVTGHNGNCVSSKQFSISVNPLPSLFFSPASPSVCAGLSSTLTVNGALSYTWQSPSVNDNSITVSPAASTIYSVRGTNRFGCISTSTV